MNPKPGFAIIQSLLWLAYFACAAVGYNEVQDEWTLALLCCTASILPFSYVYYYWFKGDNKLLKPLWIILTTMTLFLYGIAAYLEPLGWDTTWSLRIGILFYVVAVVYPHYYVFEDYAKKKNKGLEKKYYFTAFVWIMFMLTAVSLFVILMHAEGNLMLLVVLIIVSLFISFGITSLFYRNKNPDPEKNHAVLGTVCVLFYTVTLALFGLLFGWKVDGDYHDFHPDVVGTGYAGVSALIVMLVGTHVWGDWLKTEEAASSTVSVNSLIF